MTATVRVVNHGPHSLELRAPSADAAGKESSVVLELGCFDVSEETLMFVLDKSVPARDLFERQCAILEVDPNEGKQELKAGTQPRETITLTLASALQAIGACPDKGVLERWLQTDPRPEVRKAAHLRERELRAVA